MSTGLKVGDAVKHNDNNRIYVLTAKVGRDPINKRVNLFEAKGLQDRIPTQLSSAEVVKYR